MKRFEVAMLFLLFVFFTSITPVCAETVNIATGDDYPPYTGKDLKGGGFSTAVVKRVFEMAGLDVNLSWLPWKRGYMQSRSTKYLGTFPYIKTPERLKDFYYSDVLAKPSISILALAFETENPIFGDFKGKRYCLPLGYAMEPGIIPFVEKGWVTIHKETKLRDCLHLLSNESNVFMTLETPVAQKEMQKYAALQSHEIEYTASYLYFIISKKYPNAAKWIQTFNKNLKELKQSGEYEEIKRVYFPVVR